MKRTLWFWLFLIIMFFLPAFKKLIELAVDFLWFNEIGIPSVFTRVLWGQLLAGGITGAAIGLFFIVNLLIALKNSAGRIAIPRDLQIHGVVVRAMESIRLLVWFIGAAIGIFTGMWAAGHWETIARFTHAVSFGSADPLLGKDIGFYVFQVPFYQFIYRGAVLAVVLATLGTAAVYVLHNAVSIFARRLTVAQKPRTHLLLLVGSFIALLSIHFQLKIYALITTPGSIVNGAGFTDIHWTLPALRVLAILALCAGIVCGITTRLKTFIPALAAVVLLFAGGLVAAMGTQLIQKFIVAPNELSREMPYIQWSIHNTRAAYTIDKIQEKDFIPDDQGLTREILAKNTATTANIRLWEHAPLLTTYSQLQEIRTYYEFLDVDNDRYPIGDEIRQVMLSPRELVPASLPSRIWINERLSYTHGYGVCMGPVNQVTPEGLPEFFIKNIPPVSTSAITVTRPEIYYGEAPAGYVVVNTRAKEFDYPSGEQNVYSTYEGTGGIRAGSLVKRLLFVAYFKELKLLLSTDIRPDSRVLINRQIMERVRRAAPFFRYDPDPYMVITGDGRLVWIIDGYTLTDAYPYASRMGPGNYIRNSVKVVVDAYNGSMTLYCADPADPIVRTYASIFPDLFKPLSGMPADILAHLRYPQMLFGIQAAVYSVYHMTDPQVFYNKEDLWRVPGGMTAADTTSMMAPYYTIMKLTGVGEKEEFILMVPFTPAKKSNMIAWMAARCDDPNYGRLLVFNFPKQKLVYGPQQIESRINQDADISKQLALWNQGGSRVIRGSLLVIPVAQSLLFVQPLYIESKGGGCPNSNALLSPMAT